MLATKVPSIGSSNIIGSFSEREKDDEGSHLLYCLNAVKKSNSESLDILFADIESRVYLANQEENFSYCGAYDLLHLRLSGGIWFEGKGDEKNGVFSPSVSLRSSSQDGIFHIIKEENYWYSVISGKYPFSPMRQALMAFLEEHEERGFELEESLKKRVDDFNAGKNEGTFLIGARRDYPLSPTLLPKKDLNCLFHDSSMENCRNNLKIYNTLAKNIPKPFEQYSRDAKNESLAYDVVLISRGEEPPKRDFTPRFEIPKRLRNLKITGVNNCLDNS